MISSVDVPMDSERPRVALVKPSSGPGPFDVSLGTYPMQPWTNKNANLKQWFNYGFNPSTWSTYALEQQKKYSLCVNELK